jgi:hypothetical protein
VTGTIYKLGFAATNLTVTGGRYVPPLAPALLFGVTDNGVDNNATLVFSDGGILGTSTDVLGTFVSPNISARIKAKAAVTVPVNNPNSPPNPNPRSTTLSINGTTGTFTVEPRGAFVIIRGMLTHEKFAGFSRAPGEAISPIVDGRNQVVLTDNRVDLPNFVRSETPVYIAGLPGVPHKIDLPAIPGSVTITYEPVD